MSESIKYYKQTQVLKYIVLFELLFYVNITYASWNHYDSIAFQQNKDHTFYDNIKSVKVELNDFDLGYSIVTLGSNDQLNISFDELDGDGIIYTYRLLHCNADWTISDIESFDYINGYNDLTIQNIQNSLNTRQRYVHYNFLFPSAEISPKISGNYLLRVYIDDATDPAFQLRIFVVYPICEIQSLIHNARNSEYIYTHHQIDATVNIKNINVVDPNAQTHLSIYQNLRQDRCIQLPEPQFYDPMTLRYEMNTTILPAGNEFRDFDIRTLRIKAKNVAAIDFENFNNNVTLVTDEMKSHQAYSNQRDINGKYVIELNENITPETDAEYCNVKFTLDNNIPVYKAKIYILGEFCNWDIDPLYEMKFDKKIEKYIGYATLKQGYYNYTYTLVRDRSFSQHDESYSEGNFRDTENDYFIFFYFREFNARYDQILGFTTVSSLR